jgi:hypothetical protein
MSSNFYDINNNFSWLCKIFHTSVKKNAMYWVKRIPLFYMKFFSQYKKISERNSYSLQADFSVAVCNELMLFFEIVSADFCLNIPLLGAAKVCMAF